MGWDPNTGLPTPAKLIELGLDWLLEKEEELREKEKKRYLI